MERGWLSLKSEGPHLQCRLQPQLIPVTLSNWLVLNLGLLTYKTKKRASSPLLWVLNETSLARCPVFYKCSKSICVLLRMWIFTSKMEPEVMLLLPIFLFKLSVSHYFYTIYNIWLFLSHSPPSFIIDTSHHEWSEINILLKWPICDMNTATE